DSRTETSSSTTNTMGVACDMVMTSLHETLRSLNSCIPLGGESVADRSAHAQCGMERLKQRRLADGLEQALHGTLSEHAWTDGLIAESGDEDDRHRLPATRQFPLEIRSGTARHGDVESE